jgi:hypothetical protein
MRNPNQNNIRFFPSIILLVLAILWFALAILFFWFKHIHFYPGIPRIFPISEIYPSTATLFSILPVIILIGLLLWIIFKTPRHRLAVFIISFMIIVLGNLLQGGIKQGFIDTLIGQGIPQPYYDATHVTNAWQFLTSFNQIQNHLTFHTKTHPSFLVLLIYYLRFFGGAKGVLIGSTLIFSASFVLFFESLKLLGQSDTRSAKFTYLFAFIPSVNIYSIHSWDALAAVGFSIFLFGMVWIYKQGLSWKNFLALFAGFLFANMMNFLALVLLGILGLTAIWMYYKEKRKDLLISFGGIILGFIVILIFWKVAFQYDHIAAYMRARSSHLANTGVENSIQSIRQYIFSRMEGLGEIGLFLSLGVLAVLISPTHRKFIGWLDSFEIILLVSTIIVVLLLFMMGINPTGETARPFMWLVPFILLCLKNIKDKTLNALIILAAVQTIAMQLAANYYW